MWRLVSAVVLLAACACRPAPKEEPPPPPPTTLPTKRVTPVSADAPLDLNKPDMVKVQLDLAASRASIREYQMTNDNKNPPDLGSLHLRLSFPQDITYDAGSGTVKSRTYPAL